MAQTLFTGYAERLVAAATNVTNITKDSVTNVKNETNSTKDAYIGYCSRDRRSYIVTRTSQVSVSRSRFHRQVAYWFMHFVRANMHRKSTHAYTGRPGTY